MPRRTREVAEQTRQDILTAAMEAFRTHGYAAATLESIAAAANVSKGALYHHFKDGKEALLLELFASHRQRIVEYMREATAHATTSTEIIRIYVETMLTLNICHPEMQGMAQLFTIVHQVPEETKIKVMMQASEGFKSYMAWLTHVITTGIESGEFSESIHPEAATALLSGAMQGLMARSRFSSEEEISNLIPGITHILLNGLQHCQALPSSTSH